MVENNNYNIVNLTHKVVDGITNIVNVFLDYSLRERLAELEHKQWAHWTRYMLDNLTDENITRWRRQIETPYKKLTEKEKQSDRSWANKVIKILNDSGTNSRKIKCK